MVIEIQIPSDVEQALRERVGPGIEQRVREDLAALWHKAGWISAGQVAAMLDVSRLEADALLKSRGVLLDMTIEEVLEDVESLRELHGH